MLNFVEILKFGYNQSRIGSLRLFKINGGIKSHKIKLVNLLNSCMYLEF